MQLNPPFFSIIIPVYNKQKFIKNTLNCVLNQTFQDFEIIIVNDGSTDDSLKIIQKIKDSRIQIYSQKNQGVSVARNLGIKNSNGKYITFLDADDFWYPNFLDCFYETLNKYPNNSIFSAAIEIETPSKIIPAQYSISNKIDDNIYLESYFEGSLKYTIICTSCAVFRKDIFDQSGIFDPEIKSGQDIDLWIRMGLIENVIFINKILARYNLDYNSLSRNKQYKTIKLKYKKFEFEEFNNPYLKKFLDFNRYSEAITNKIVGNNQNYKFLKSNINFNNLNLKQKIIINTPTSLLKLLLKMQPILIKLNLRNSIYK